MSKYTTRFYQEDNIEYIINKLGTELWVQVSGNKQLNGSDACFWTALMPIDKVDEALKNASWESTIGTEHPGFTVYGSEEIVYNKDSDSPYEQLVISREFYGVRPNYVEISEEFRLLNDLYHDKSNDTFYSILSNGEMDDVVKIENNNVFIKLNYLVRFATAKQMVVALFFDIRFDIEGTLSDLELEKYSKVFTDNSKYYMDIFGDQMYYKGKAKSYTTLMGKKLIYPKEVSSCGYWPYDRSCNYEEYIIGNKDDGNPKVFTSNPEELANYLGANPEAPHYLTPVFFKREVLQKYLSHPELYSVEDGYLHCGGLWGMSIDNHNKEYVSAYLGDLGRYLPETEQKHWKNYNVLVEGKISEIKLRRDFFSQFADAEIADLKFKAIFSNFCTQWLEKFGWPLFLPLSEHDEYNFQKLCLPVTNSQEEFDHLVLSLVKVIIDSLNEKEIIKEINSARDLRGSISKLEQWFMELDLPNYQNHILFLRGLQELRSSGTGHRKGNNYEKIATEIGLNDDSFINVFERLLLKAVDFLEYLRLSFLTE